MLSLTDVFIILLDTARSGREVEVQHGGEGQCKRRDKNKKREII